MGLDDWVKRLVRSNAMTYGKGEFELLGLKGVILPVKTQVYMLENIARESSTDQAMEVMHETGKDHGKLCVEEVARANKVSLREFVDSVIDTANLMGMGEINVENFDKVENVLEVSIAESPMVEAFENSELFYDIDRSIHEFWRGAFEAMAEELFDTKIVSVEESCEFLDDEKCLIKCEAKR